VSLPRTYRLGLRPSSGGVPKGMDRAVWPLSPQRSGTHPRSMIGSEVDSKAAADAVSRLTITRLLRADPAGLCRALSDPAWLGRPIDGRRDGPAGRPGLRRVETDLAFELSDDPRTISFRKAAVVDLGAITEPDGSCTGIVEWRAATFAPLFPVFSGRLRVHDGGVHLEGVYAPPGGGVGLLVDKAFLHHFAERTAVWFLDRLMDELAATEPGAR
jgi:hypothetical protein